MVFKAQFNCYFLRLNHWRGNYFCSFWSSPRTTTIGEDITTRHITLSGDATIAGNATIAGDLKAKTGRTATFVIAASDSLPQSKAQADFVADGIDDQETIQAAIDALPASGGKVLLMEGSFHVSQSINLRSNLCLEGCGTSTRIRLKDGAITTSGVAGVTPTITHNIDGAVAKDPTDIIHDVCIKNLYLDGNLANQVSGAWSEVIRFHTVNHFVIENVTVVNARSAIVPINSDYGIIINNSIKNAIGDGIGPSICRNLIISNNYLLDARQGIDLARSRNCVVTNNIVDFVNIAPNEGIRLKNTSYSTVANNIVTNNSGVHRGSGIILTAFSAPANPWEFNQNNTINNNIVYRFSNEIRFQAFPNATIPMSDFTIKDNEFLNCLGNILLEPEKHWIRNNRGLLTENSGTATFSGTGTTTTFTIAHGMTGDLIPTVVDLEAKSADAAGAKHWSADATNITITFITAPPAGTNNVVISWEAKVR